MQLENLKLVVAALSGEVYLSEISKNGTMSDTRRVATQDCLETTMEWFMKNDRKMVAYEADEKASRPSLFFTEDEEKAERILAILEES